MFKRKKQAKELNDLRSFFDYHEKRIELLENEIFELKNKPKYKKGDKVELKCQNPFYGGDYIRYAEIVNHFISNYRNPLGENRITYKYNVIIDGELEVHFESHLNKIKD